MNLPHNIGYQDNRLISNKYNCTQLLIVPWKTTSLSDLPPSLLVRCSCEVNLQAEDKVLGAQREIGEVKVVLVYSNQIYFCHFYFNSCKERCRQSQIDMTHNPFISTSSQWLVTHLTFEAVTLIRSKPCIFWTEALELVSLFIYDTLVHTPTVRQHNVNIAIHHGSIIPWPSVIHRWFFSLLP